MCPRFGRAAWLSDRSMGSIDAGGRLVVIVLTALAEGKVEASGSDTYTDPGAGRST